MASRSALPFSYVLTGNAGNGFEPVTKGSRLMVRNIIQILSHDPVYRLVEWKLEHVPSGQWIVSSDLLRLIEWVESPHRPRNDPDSVFDTLCSR